MTIPGLGIVEVSQGGKLRAVRRSKPRELDYESRGLVARWELPLGNCPTANEQFTRMHWAERVRLKKATLKKMLAQSGRARMPLAGKPMIIATRYSSRELDPDQASSWLKLPLDCAKVDDGLGFIVDDGPAYVNVTARWEKAPPRGGRCVIEIWADDNAKGKIK